MPLHSIIKRRVLHAVAGGIGSLQARVVFVAEASSSAQHASSSGSGSSSAGSSSGRSARPAASAKTTSSQSTNNVLAAHQGSQVTLVKGLSAQKIVRVSEAVMKKLTGLESVESVDVVAEIDVPQAADFLQPGAGCAWLPARDDLSSNVVNPEPSRDISICCATYFSLQILCEHHQHTSSHLQPK